MQPNLVAQIKQGRRVTLIELSEATGINRMTLSRMLNVKGYSTSTDTLDKLCRFFKCEVGDLAQYIDDAPVDEPGVAETDSATVRTASGRRRDSKA